LVFLLPDYNGFGYAIISSWILGEIILRTKHNEERYKIAKRSQFIIKHSPDRSENPLMLGFSKRL
jgi:hypothetical protein